MCCRQSMPLLEAILPAKFGTKAVALKADPVSYMKGFGEIPNDSNLDALYAKAEGYLVQVIKEGKHCKTVNELWYLVYHQSKVTSLDELPPTSYSLRRHLPRSFYSVFFCKLTA